MAIIIPSKNIYEINNQKVVDNEVDNIEFEAKRVSPKNEYNTTVYNGDFDTENKYTTDKSSSGYEEKTWRPAVGEATVYAIAYGEIKPYYFSSVIKINRKYIDKIVSSIYGGADDEGQSKIKYSAVCEKKTATITAKYYISGTDQKITDISYNYPSEVGETQNVSLPNSITVTNNISPFNFSKVVSLDDKSNLKYIGETIEIRETEEFFEFDFIVFCGGETYEIISEGDNSIPNYPFKASGTATIYIPKSITITVYGNTIGIDLQDETVKIGDGQHVYSFNGNELIQKQNNIYEYGIGIRIGDYVARYGDYWYHEVSVAHNVYEPLLIGDVVIWGEEAANIVEYNEKICIQMIAGGKFYNHRNAGTELIVNRTAQSQIDHTYKKIIREFKSGKEVATIKCSIGDYFYEDGRKAISINDGVGHMMFQIGDEVIPHIFGTNNKDYSMSFYPNGDPKKFRIIGTSILYNGAPQQEITIQEIPYK